jgi:hypothetical protein
VSQVNVNQPPEAPPPATDGTGYGFIVGIIVAIIVIVLILWLLVFNQGNTPPGNTNGGGQSDGAAPQPSGWRIISIA